MKKCNGIPLFLVIVIITPLLSLAQDIAIPFNKNKLNNNQADSLKKADELFKQENYLMAFPFYSKLNEAHPDELYLKYKLGICYLYKSDEHSQAVKYLKEVASQKPQTPDLDFYLGQAYLIAYQYDEAIAAFNKYLLQKIPAEKRQLTEHYLKNCANGKVIIAAPVEISIENIGDVINTEAAEYVPVISSDEEVMIFTYRGEQSLGGLQDANMEPDPYGSYFEDVFISEKINDKWTDPVSIGDNINGEGHDASIALSADGQKLLIYKNTTEDQGDILISKLKGKNWSVPEPLKGGVNSKFWEGSASFSADEQTLYFSSERPGGLGGRDIYKATLQSDDTWGNVENLGNTINTPHDDDSPFIHPSGKILLFSSKGHASIGGYDIFQSDWRGGTWTRPINIGYPVNTSDDDIYYVLSADGKRGYYSSGKSGGYGQQDIYKVEPGIIDRKTALVLVKGQVTLNGQPAEANILISYITNNEVFGNYNSNAASGKYLVNLPAGSNYKITYQMEGLEDKVQNINTTAIDSFLEAVIDIDFYTRDYEKAHPIPEVKELDSIRVVTVPAMTKLIADTVQPTKEHADHKMIEKFTNAELEGLEYKVQIGAFRLPENFNFNNLLGLGKVEKKNYEDNVTRFTIGSFKTFQQVQAHKKKVIEKGTTDAFVIAIYKGKRISIKELQNLIFTRE